MLPHTDAAILALIRERQQSIQQAVAGPSVRHTACAGPLREQRRELMPCLPALANALLAVVRLR
jgi:hypothetical protein